MKSRIKENVQVVGLMLLLLCRRGTILRQEILLISVSNALSIVISHAYVVDVAAAYQRIHYSGLQAKAALLVADKEFPEMVTIWRGLIKPKCNTSAPMVATLNGFGVLKIIQLTLVWFLLSRNMASYQSRLTHMYYNFILVASSLMALLVRLQPRRGNRWIW